MALFLDILCVLFFAFTSPVWFYRMLLSKKHRMKYRAGWGQRFGWVPKREADRPCIWIHGVSVGEILTARALLRKIAERHPDWEVVLSTTTLDARRVAERTYPGRIIFYFPMQFSFMIRRTLRRIRPTAVVLIEQELWANFLFHADQAGVPVLLVNGRISGRSERLLQIVKWPLFRPFRKIRRYCVQTQVYADRFAALGIPRSQIFVTGTMKYDNIPAGPRGGDERKEARRLLGIANDDWVIVAGSTHAGEEKALLEIFRDLRAGRPRSRLVLVPRHMDRIPRVESLLRERGERYVKKTDFDAGRAGATDREVILVDTMGELLQVYPAANLVFVGGSLVPVGGHNMLEPASLGLAVVIGPHVFKCAEDVSLLVKGGGGILARDQADLRSILIDLSEHPRKVKSLGENAARVIVEHQGATDRNLAHLEEILSERAEAPRRRPRALSVAAL